MVPPPIQNWTSVATQHLRIERLFPLTDTLLATDVELGMEMVKVTLKDIYQSNLDIPLSLLKGEEEEKLVLKDSVDYKELTDAMLEHRGYFRYPCVFPRMLELVEGKGRDAAACLVAGFSSLNLKYFPWISYRTFKGTKRVNWNFSHFIDLRKVGQPITEEGKAVRLAEKICQDILDRGLTEQGHVERYREWGMPWLPMVLRRMPPEVTKEDKQETLLVYVSCIAILTNGGFIDYDKLNSLHKSIPISQKRMLDLRLRSVFSLRIICRDTVLYKLADDIPTLVQLPHRNTPPKKKDKDEDKEEEECHQPAVEDIDTQLVEKEEHKEERSDSMAVPAGKKTRWSPQELDLVKDTGDLKADYDNYVKGCAMYGIPHRSKKSFNTVRWRLRNDK